MLYDNYVWRIISTNPSLDIQLPKDLEWIDEFTWSPISQDVTISLTGALTIQEFVQLMGRHITLQGKDDMAWIRRTKGNNLKTLRNVPALTVKLQFLEYDIDTDTYSSVNILHDFTVMFRHSDPPALDLENVLRYNNFEPDAWYKVRSLKFMEAHSSASSPCTANVSLSLTTITGIFNVGEIVEGGTSGATGTVLGFTSPDLDLYVSTGGFQIGETITSPSGTAVVN